MLTMSEEEYKKFYRNTIEGYSISMKDSFCKKLLEEKLITYEDQINLEDNPDCIYCESKNSDTILGRFLLDINRYNVFDKFDFTKLYKYSVPFFYRGDIVSKIEQLITDKKLYDFSAITYPLESYTIGTTLNETVPVILQENNIIMIKFVILRSYYTADFDTINYRYSIVTFFNKDTHSFEVRYDNLKYNPSLETKTEYKKVVDGTLRWIKEILGIEVYSSEYNNLKDVIKADNEKVKIFKQMMDMGTSGMAELTASEEQDYILPFVGEIQEILDENEELFNKAPEIKKLITDYLEEKEVTASYPYIYLLWLKGGATKNFIVKVTFSFFDGKYTLLQHLAAKCNDYGMERMNDAINYLSSNRALTEGARL